MNNFNNWVLKKQLLQNENHSPLLDTKQQVGDRVYFGIHDLNRYYKTHNCVPPLDFADIMDKTGEITDIDPVEDTVSASVSKAPYHLGYHSLENKNQREKRGKNHIQLPISALLDFSDFVDSTHKVWLVVDHNTKYQSGLLKQIRKKEMRAYMDRETQATNFELDDTDNPLDLGIEVGFRQKNREVEPFYCFKSSYDPSIQSNQGWKSHGDFKKYDYFPE